MEVPQPYIVRKDGIFLAKKQALNKSIFHTTLFICSFISILHLCHHAYPELSLSSAISVPMNRQNFALDIRNITSWVNSPDICSTQISQKHQHFPSKAAIARYTPRSAVHISPGGAALPTAALAGIGACSTRFEPCWQGQWQHGGKGSGTYWKSS